MIMSCPELTNLRRGGVSLVAVLLNRPISGIVDEITWALALLEEHSNHTRRFCYILGQDSPQVMEEQVSYAHTIFLHRSYFYCILLKTEKAFLKQPKVFLCSKKTGKENRPGNGGNRHWKSAGLGFRNPREATEGQSAERVSQELI